MDYVDYHCHKRLMILSIKAEGNSMIRQSSAFCDIINRVIPYCASVHSDLV